MLLGGRVLFFGFVVTERMGSFQRSMSASGLNSNRPETTPGFDI